jgi:hypothetical protein
MLGNSDAIVLWAGCKMYMIVRREGSDVLILDTRSSFSRNMLPSYRFASEQSRARSRG